MRSRKDVRLTHSEKEQEFREHISMCISIDVLERELRTSRNFGGALYETMKTAYKKKSYNNRVEADISYDYYRNYESRRGSYETERYSRYDSRMSELLPKRRARDSYVYPNPLYSERTRSYYESQLEYYPEFLRSLNRTLSFAPSGDYKSVSSRATETRRAKRYENYYAENYNFHNTFYGSHVPHDRFYMSREIEHEIYGPNYSETIQSKAYRQASRYAYNDHPLAHNPRDYPVTYNSRDYVYDYPPARNQHNSFDYASVSDWHDYLPARNRYDYLSDCKQYDYPPTRNQYDYPAGHNRYKYEYEYKYSNQHRFARDYYYNSPRADSGNHYDRHDHGKKGVDCENPYIMRKRKDRVNALNEEYTENEDILSVDTPFKKSKIDNDLNAERSESYLTRYYKKERKSDSSSELKEATSYAKRRFFEYGSCSMSPAIDTESIHPGDSSRRRITSARDSKIGDVRDSRPPCRKTAASGSASSMMSNTKNTKREDNMKYPGAINVTFNISTNNGEMKVYPNKIIVADEQKTCASSALTSPKERKSHPYYANRESGSVKGKAEHSKGYPTSSSWDGTSKVIDNSFKATAPEQKKTVSLAPKSPTNNS